MICLVYIVPIVIFFFGLRKVRERSWGRCTNRVLLTGKVVIVTGANSGIGYEVAKELALREAHVILACRSLERAAQAVCQIKQQTGGRSSVLIPMLLDLGSICSIRNFVENIETTYQCVDVLVNNAGVSYPPDLLYTTNDGFEIHLGTNHLGHYLLTTLLANSLQRAKRSRVITVASKLHERGRLEQLLNNDSDPFRTLATYADSKLANVYFSHELADRLEGVGSYAVCPGWVYTNLFRHSARRWYHYILVAPVAFFFMRTARQGAQTIVYCVTQPELDSETGYIYRDCKLYDSTVKFDADISRRLWELSDKAINTVDK